METPAARPPDNSPAPRGADATALEPADLWSPAALAGRLVEVTSAPAAASRHGSVRPGHDASARIWDSAPPARGTGPAALSAATTLVWKAQLAGEPCAWIAARPSTFYPPDLDEGGIDLAALVVVRTPDATAAARAADKLLRSGAFGLVVLDLGDGSEVVTSTTTATTRTATAATPGAPAMPMEKALPTGSTVARTAAAPTRAPAETTAKHGQPRGRGLSMAPALTSRLLGLAQKHRATVVFVTEKADDAPSVAPVVSLRVAATRRRSSTAVSGTTTLGTAASAANSELAGTAANTVAGTAAPAGTGARPPAGAGRFACSVEATKDKRRPPGWTWQETFRGPPGLR